MAAVYINDTNAAVRLPSGEVIVFSPQNENEILAVLANWPRFYKEIWQHASYEATVVAIAQSGSLLENVQAIHRTPEIIKLALKNDGEAIRFVLSPTTDQLWTALLQTPDAIDYIHDDATVAMYLYVLSQAIYTFDLIPTPNSEMREIAARTRRFTYPAEKIKQNIWNGDTVNNAMLMTYSTF